jgi:hypothetical protein
MSELNATQFLLQEIANQAYSLGMGLQNAAPSNANGPPRSVSYLLEICEKISALNKNLDNISYAADTSLNPDNALREKQANLLQSLRDLSQLDHELRIKYEVAEKFRFIKERLQKLIDQTDHYLQVIEVKEQKIEFSKNADEVLVYVYLYNSKGLLLRNWSPLIGDKVFYEHSVNRPIYAHQAHLDELIRTKKIPQQHGYLTIAVKMEDIQPLGEGVELQDSLGNPMIKVKEGALRVDKMQSLTHNLHEYILAPDGELIKKA